MTSNPVRFRAPRCRFLLLFVCSLAQGCGGVLSSAANDASTAPAPPQPAPSVMSEETEASIPANVSALSLDPASVVAPSNEPPSAPSSPPVAAPEPQPGAPASPQSSDVLDEARKMVDVEAHLSIEVDEVPSATQAARELALRSGGQVVNENLTQENGFARAVLTFRIPANAAGNFLTSLEAVGALRTRQVKAKDIGREFYDASLRLTNLEAARKRYEEILADAKTVEEVLRLESELTRLRGEIEQLKGRLRWMRDRAARATVHVTLFTRDSAPRAVVKPKAKLRPGLRASYLRDLRGDAGSNGYWGAGVSLGPTRAATIELQGFRRAGSGSSGLDGLFVTLNGRFYSEYLGNGDRRFLNPYLGLRGGYARFLGNAEALAGATLGLEVVNTEWLMVDADVRMYGLFGSDAGGHLGMEPSLGASVAF